MAMNVSIRHNQVCGVKDNRTTSLILPIKLDYKTCKKSCENLGGKLPLYYNAGDLEDMIEKISSDEPTNLGYIFTNKSRLKLKRISTTYF